ncbi:ParB/RepB/Spo0J family partition protein [Profundibacterium mesophilum]|uniref:ParB-like nuclease n=1 Tax=Profundibacterium mesophilum KAUST100406-0324 TaxID=1037889 RepID=A0A921TBQ1_9RHOB|nr:ParB N-terminal domain-containing protein [Profundibacterium mesophilum]KAF0676035.1 ParB-like nuclease [Profundibacterium mesophilum KAUST100406-0324]
MAKRRKLEAPDAAELAKFEEGFAIRPVQDRLGVSAPIAQVAGEAAQAGDPRGADARIGAAREEADAGAWRRAIEEGRVVEDIPLAAVEMDHVVRDRIVADHDALEELVASLRLNGQRLPIEVIALGTGRYGLVSGWRRMEALRRLHSEGGAGTVKAIVRAGQEAGDLYSSMVEENEIRAQLTPYERGRIAVVAADQGAFESSDAAVEGIFAVASKAKRSKIRSFALIHEELGDLLIFPTMLSERNGLRLAGALRSGAGPDIRARLERSQGDDAKQEWALIEPAVKAAESTGQGSTKGGRPRSIAPAERMGLGHGITAELSASKEECAIQLHLPGRSADAARQIGQQIARLLEANPAMFDTP